MIFKVENRANNAIDLHNKGCNCCQSVLRVFSKEYGLDEKLAFKIATGFGGGMGRTAGTCGVVTGALMVFGLVYGMRRPEEAEAKEKTYKLVREFIKQFKKRNKSITCKDLLGCDISTKKGFEEAKKKRLFKIVCSKYIKDSVETLETLL